MQLFTYIEARAADAVQHVDIESTDSFFLGTLVYDDLTTSSIQDASQPQRSYMDILNEGPTILIILHKIFQASQASLLRTSIKVYGCLLKHF